MDSSVFSNSQLAAGLNPAAISASTNEVSTDIVSVVETPILGRQNGKRMTTTCKSVNDGQVVSVLVEEYHGERLMFRNFEQHKPIRSITRETYEPDGTLISSETERQDLNGVKTKVVIRGTGKSSTTRIMAGEVEARATERSILIETPKASYSYQPFDGKWSSFYKEINMKLELKANFLKSPNATLNGPDGIKLIFRNGRLADMTVMHEFCESPNLDGGKIPSIIE